MRWITSEYPSHGFVIDQQEVKELFKDVRDPTQQEILLADQLGNRARLPDNFFGQNEQPPFRFLSGEPTKPEDEIAPTPKEDDKHETTGDYKGPELGSVARESGKKSA